MGGGQTAHVGSCEMVSEVTSEGHVLCVFMDTDSSQSREIAGQPSHLWLVQQ